jgi:aryl-alcohol dehydrogenase-like predicted oxidoreductase
VRLALGTAQFGSAYGIGNRHGPVSDNEAADIVRYARDRGMDTLDTAVAYGDSESRLGEIGVETWRIVSKLPAVPDDCRDVTGWARATARESLQRLRVKRLDGLLLHRPRQLLEQRGEHIYLALQQLRREGLTRGIGISIYDPAELDELPGGYQFDLVQAPFNVIDRRLADSGWLARLYRRGVEIHVRSVFLQGVLLLGTEERPAWFARWDALWTAWDQWLGETDVRALQACLGFVLSFPEISRVIVGVDRLEHIESIMGAVETPVPQPPCEVQSNDADLINPSRWAVQ